MPGNSAKRGGGAVLYISRSLPPCSRRWNASFLAPFLLKPHDAAMVQSTPDEDSPPLPLVRDQDIR